MVSDRLIELKAKLPSDVALVAVSKFHPVERLMEAYNAGQRLFGENRPQELAAKVPLMPPDVQWHFIGHLQTNKLKLVLPYVSLVQSVDSLHLLEAINAWGQTNNRVIDILLEVHIASETSKQGFSEEEILSLFGIREGMRPSLRSSGFGRGREATVSEGISSTSTYIRVKGLMGMASLTEDEEIINAEFGRIETLFQRIREARPDLADTFTELSIGMSGDWPLAVRHGATMVRIGTDIFGAREY
jgi:hypothetical protein